MTVARTWRFHAGDSLWIKLRSPVGGRVYVIEETAGYAPTLLLPNVAIEGVKEHVQAGEILTLPSEAHPFEFDERNGSICVTVGFIPDSTGTGDFVDRSREVLAKGLVVGNSSPVFSFNDQASLNARSAVGCTIVLHQTALGAMR